VPELSLFVQTKPSKNPDGPKDLFCYRICFQNGNATAVMNMEGIVAIPLKFDSKRLVSGVYHRCSCYFRYQLSTRRPQIQYYPHICQTIGHLEALKASVPPSGHCKGHYPIYAHTYSASPQVLSQRGLQ